MIATKEQEKIINCTSQYIAINALAGTGKTTTLNLYAKTHNNKKMLYLCYNKSIAEAAKKVFPRNVDVMTFHSLAYRSVGYKYQEKLKSSLSVNDIIKILSLNQSKRANLLGQSILNTLNSYCASQEDYVQATHVNKKYLESGNVLSGKTEEEIEEVLGKIARLTQKLWDIVTDPANPSPITHDIYLKMFTLNPPQMDKYQSILIDEAQDLTPCFVNFIEKQKGQIIIVGDRYQSINQWRGSFNYIDKSQGKFEEFYLTESFRFSQSLADFANCALVYLDSNKKIKALSPVATQLVEKKHASVNILSVKALHKSHNQKNSYAVVARHNWSIYDKTLEFIKAKEDFYVEGNLDLKELNEIAELYSFKKTRCTSHHVYEGYNSFEQIESLINEGVITDSDIIKRVYVISKWGDKTANNLALLKNYCKESKDKKVTQETIIITTVHKAKGKEYDTVELLEDFTCHMDYANEENLKFFMDAKGNKKEIYISHKGQTKKCWAAYGTIVEKKWEEEMNIFYVALTRAKEKIILPSQYYKLLNSLTHLNKKGYDESLKTALYEQAIVFTPELISMFERDKLRSDIAVDKVIEKPKVVKI